MDFDDFEGWRDEDKTPPPEEEDKRHRLGALSERVRKALSDDKLKETLVADVVRRAIARGGEVVDHTGDSLKELIADLPVPTEVVERLSGRLDEYKAEALRVLKEELHDFLTQIELGAELQKMLSSFSLEITTQIRFVPNEKRPRTQVISKTRVKRAPSSTPPSAPPVNEA
ncbi:hypothetical protein KKF91_18615 [Myxococcota bacterium]|nr:hypothetical protein [Myxococcota bacterium]MBU1432556.1 hypothetical protein [Myxococcota bacterium]MBU1898562.1 hypothetical protein [Myxococcota bacterium]